MAHATIGSSIFSDEDFLALSFEEKGAFVLLQPWAADRPDGLFAQSAATAHMAYLGYPDPGGIVQRLVDANMIRKRGTRWELAGWDKYQTPLPEPEYKTRPTTRIGRQLARDYRVLPEGYGKQYDLLAELEADSQTGVADTVSLRDVSATGGHGADTVSATVQHRADTVSATEEGSPLPLPLPLPAPQTPHPTLTRSPALPAPLSSPGASAYVRNGEFDSTTTDIRDTLYELTQVQPWGKEWADEALEVQAKFGLDALDAEVRRAYTHLKYTRKPWSLIKQADAVLAKGRAIAKEREFLEARQHRIARGPTRPEKITGADLEELAKGYKELPEDA